jgi:outer membrane protein
MVFVLKSSIRNVIIFSLLGLLAVANAAPMSLSPTESTSTHDKLLTINEAVLLALRNNPDVRNAKLQRIVDKFALEVAHNEFEPQYTLTGSANYGTGQTGNYAVTPGVSLKTPYGTEFGLNVANTIAQNGNTAVGTVTVTQPLLQGLGRAVTQANLFAALQNEKNNKLALKDKVSSTVVTVVQAYYQLVGDYNNLKTNQLSLQNSQTTLNQTQLKIKAGKSPRTDEIQQASSVATQQVDLEQVYNRIQQDYQNLLVVLGLDPTSHLTVDKNIILDNSPLPTLQESINTALINNISYQQTLNTYKVTERQLLVAHGAQKWQLNLQASASRQISGNNGEGVADNSATPLNPIINVPAPTGSGTNKTVSLNLTIPIDDVSAKQQLVNAQIGLQQATISLEQAKRQLVSTVTNDHQNLISLRQQIKLSENSVALARQSLAIEQMKYNYGRSTPIEVNQLQTNLTEQELDLTGQKIQYLNALQQFYQELGTTLDKWDITLTELKP